jgi:hypothetical protein
MLARGYFSQAQFELRYVDPAHVLKAAAKRTADAAQKLKKVRKEKKLPIVLGDILGFGFDTKQP